MNFLVSLILPLIANYILSSLFAFSDSNLLFYFTDMKAVTVKELKNELFARTHSELIEICLHLSKFKKENKELLTYLLFEAENERGYIESIQYEIEEQFNSIKTKSFYLMKKEVRKILRNVKKYIRYSKNKETEIELLLHFCKNMKNFSPQIMKSITMQNLFQREIALMKKKLASLHEDLQHDYLIEIQSL